MIFMGEEFACENPFLFFVDFEDQRLRKAVIKGRKAEYPQHDWTKCRLPTDEETFFESKIGTVDDGDSAMRDWYKQLIELRKTMRRRQLISDQNLTVKADGQSGTYIVQYDNGQQILSVATRLSEKVNSIELDLPGQVILDSRDDSTNQLGSPHSRIYLATNNGALGISDES